jgi:hypothetical protein
MLSCVLVPLHSLLDNQVTMDNPKFEPKPNGPWKTKSQRKILKLNLNLMDIGLDKKGKSIRKNSFMFSF